MRLIGEEVKKLSARPFWVLFTAAVIVLVQLLVVKPVADWRIDDEIAALKIPYAAGFEPDKAHPDRVITKEDLNRLELTDKLRILYNSDRTRAFAITFAMLIMGVLAGFLVASVAFRELVGFGDRLRQLSAADKIAIFLGVLIGLLLSAILLPIIVQVLKLQRNPVVISVASIIIMYLSVMALMGMKEELKFYFPGLSRSRELADRPLQKPKILDTNVIIDGRIADLCRTGFVEGKVYIPGVVLEELQHIADSPDTLKRARGRRGLDILNQMRKELDLVVEATEQVNPEDPEAVDARLVKLAQDIDGAIITNDFNLNKVAELQGVTVLNINELANALKPVVLPGEEMTVSIIKEGREPNQGIEYLDDGTMVVVEAAKRHIGGTVDVVVTSVLQTIAGKMIFANLKAVQQEEDELIDRNIRSYSGFRPRKKTR